MSDLSRPLHPPPSSPYEKLGGEMGVRRLAHRFYELMDELPEAWTIRQMHPESLQGSEESLFEFLSGWLGGPPLFMLQRRHPRLHMRHAPYFINTQAHDEWLLCMRLALKEQVFEDPFREALELAFAHMAQHLIHDTSASQVALGEALEDGF